MDNILECKVYVYCGFGWLGGIKVINFCVLFVMIFGFKIKNVFIMIVLLISRFIGIFCICIGVKFMNFDIWRNFIEFK